MPPDRGPGLLRPAQRRRGGRAPRRSSERGGDSGRDEEERAGNDRYVVRALPEMCPAPEGVVDLVLGVRSLWVLFAGGQHVESGAQRRRVKELEITVGGCAKPRFDLGDGEYRGAHAGARDTIGGGGRPTLPDARPRTSGRAPGERVGSGWPGRLKTTTGRREVPLMRNPGWGRPLRPSPALRGCGTPAGSVPRPSSSAPGGGEGDGSGLRPRRVPRAEIRDPRTP